MFCGDGDGGESAAVDVLLSLAAKASAHGAGVWKDPNHYVGEESLAGLRFIAEQPAHVLQVVGTDDGVTWWHITGTCSGEGMTNINLDFSPKGGPSGVTGKWTYDPQWVIAREKIHFPDGNVWESTGYVPGAIELDDAVDDHVGVFVDETTDIGRVEDVHFNPWFSSAHPFIEYQLVHGRAFVFGRSDWEYVFNTFALS